MAAVRGPNKRSLAFVVALTLLLSLVVPFVGTALASHSTADNSHDLEVTPETDNNPVGTTHTLTATVADGAAGTEVDFEIEAGGTARAGCTPQNNGTCTGGTAGSDNTPTTPDMTCTTGAGGTCQVFFTSDSPGTFTVRAWVDEDEDNATFDADQTEAADAAESADEPTGTTGQNPGSRTEPDDTDVVTKTFFAALPANVRLDCTPETATNPATGEGSTETYTCTLTNTQGTVSTADDTPIQGFKIDGENNGGANDPDNGPTTPVDYNDCGTTDANGQAQCQVPASEAQTGTTQICFWVDEDADNEFNIGGLPEDGSECNEGLATVNDNQTDVVEKTWQAPGQASRLVLTPENDQNQEGTSHTVTATVTDFQGNPVAGVPVDFDVTGRNAGDGCDAAVTNAQGQASCTYSDAGNADIPAGGAAQGDTITAFTDPNDNDADDGAAEPNDTASKFWFDQVPTATDIVADADANAGGCEGTDLTAEDTATNNVINDPAHEGCVTVNYGGAAGSGTAQPLPGETVTLTMSGPGEFYDDANDNDVRDTGEALLGQTIQVTTDAAGQARFDIWSDETGTATITGTADGQSDSVTKTWTAGDARNIDCTPEEATNRSGTNHTITCLVTDRLGNPVSGELVILNEEGPGRTVESRCLGPIFGVGEDCDSTDSSGEAEFSLTSNADEEGTQTAIAELGDDLNDSDAAGDLDDECDQPANEAPGGGANDAPGATAGNCEDTVNKTWSQTITPPEGFPRTLTLEASKNKLVYGNQVTLTAAVSAGSTETPQSCIQGVTVTFSRTVVGQDTTEVVGTATTDSNGEASIDLSADRSANYTASVDQTDECAQAASNPESVLVKKKVKLRVSDQTPRRGTIVRFRVTVLPCGGADGPGHEGDRVQLYKTVGGQLAKIDAKRTNDECKATFRKRARGSNTYQARSPKSDADHLGGKSRKKAVQAHR